MIPNPKIRCDGPRQSGGSTKISSLTGCEAKTVEITDNDAEAINPEDFEPKRIELDRNLGTRPSNPEKLVHTRFDSNHRCIPIAMQRRALQTWLPDSCDYICSSSRSDLMSSDVLTKLPATFGFIHSCVSHMSCSIAHMCTMSAKKKTQRASLTHPPTTSRRRLVRKLEGNPNAVPPGSSVSCKGTHSGHGVRATVVGCFDHLDPSCASQAREV